MITVYTVLAGYTSTELTDQVNSYILNGWQPQGGISVIFGNQELRYYQAVVRENSNGYKT